MIPGWNENVNKAGPTLAGLMLTTEAMIADAPKEKREGGVPGGMGGMGMGM